MLKDEAQVEAAIRGIRQSPGSAKVTVQLPELPQQFWLIEAPAHMVVRGSEKRCEIWQIDLNCQVLDGFVARYYDVTEHQSFDDANVKNCAENPSRFPAQPLVRSFPVRSFLMELFLMASFPAQLLNRH
ncbi:MAG: hypothetical protein HC771_12510 [Synechococcales cyanobacterium CRU_2_2]|nr:hypothetical protein [Synechococcales cyanobacterium CRU_2_2]